MNDLLLVLIGAAIGTYFAEPIREIVPILDGGKDGKTSV